MKTITRLAGVAALCTLVSAWNLAIAADDPKSPSVAPAKEAEKQVLADGNFKIGPTYADAPELKVKDDVPKGTLHKFTMDSTDSKIYPGLKGAYKRNVAVYVPKNYVAGTASPFIVVQDGMGYTGSMTKILDNMIHERRLPTMIADIHQLWRRRWQGERTRPRIRHPVGQIC